MPRLAKWLGDAMEGLMGSKMPLMKVMEIKHLSPSVKRIKFKGNLSGMNFHLGYAVIIRVSDTEFRNYTASFSDIEKGILEIIFHIHGAAPGSLYIDNLQTGDAVRIGAPRGQKHYNPSVKQYLLFGDETSLGLAFSFHACLKKNLHQYQFYLELDEENKNVPQLLGLDNCQVFSKKDTFKNEQWISDLPILKTSSWLTAHVVLTGNVRSVQILRRSLKKNNIKGKIAATGYWLEGKTGL